MKYAKFSDDFLSDFRLDDNGETLVLTDKRGYTRAVKLLPYEERPQGDLISRSALIEDFKSRLADCNDWIENAKDKETKIRASAVKTFIAEVILTIGNAPTIKDRSLEIAQKSIELGRKVGQLEGKLERPQGEWYYNSQNGWHCSICHETVKDMPTVKGKADYNFCPRCGADMRGDKNDG